MQTIKFFYNFGTINNIYYLVTMYGLFSSPVPSIILTLEFR